MKRLLNFEVPVPTELLQFLWFAMGILFGRAFGKKLDQSIQGDPWFKRRHRLWREILRRILDFTHHFWIGLILVVYFPEVPEAVWFGWGIFVDDLPDIPRRLKGYFRQGS